MSKLEKFEEDALTLIQPTEYYKLQINIFLKNWKKYAGEHKDKTQDVIGSFENLAQAIEEAKRKVASITTLTKGKRPLPREQNVHERLSKNKTNMEWQQQNRSKLNNEMKIKDINTRLSDDKKTQSGKPRQQHVSSDDKDEENEELQKISGDSVSQVPDVTNGNNLEYDQRRLSKTWNAIDNQENCGTEEAKSEVPSGELDEVTQDQNLQKQFTKTQQHTKEGPVQSQNDEAVKNPYKKDHVSEHDNDGKLTISKTNPNYAETAMVSSKLSQSLTLMPLEVKNKGKDIPRQEQSCNTCDVFILEKNSEGSVKKIIDELGERLKEDPYSLNVIRRTEPINITVSSPLLVVCLVVTRLGSDAAEAIKGLTDLGRTMLLIFHHKDVHVLPVISSHLALTEPEFKSLGGILDFAFYTGKGIYSCPMNDSSLKKLTDFIRNFESVR